MMMSPRKLKNLDIKKLLGTINILGLGLVGSYAWRTYENTKRRPQAVIMSIEKYKEK